MRLTDFILLSDSLPELFILLNGDGDICAVNRSAQKFLEMPARQLIGQNLASLTDMNTEKMESMLRVWRRSRDPIPAVIKWNTISKDKRSGMQCQGFLLQPRTDDDEVQVVLRCEHRHSIARDFVGLNRELEHHKALLQKLMHNRETLEKEHERAVVTLSSIGDAVITTDASGNVEFLNPVAESLTGWTTSDAAALPITGVFNIVNEITRRPVSDPVSRCLREGLTVGLANHTLLLSRDGTEYIIEDSAAPIHGRNGDILGAVLVFRDITGDRLAQRQLEYLAQHDTLTGLKNRYYFEQKLEHVVDLASRDRHHAALIYIDLDQFKIINDTAGHAAGDDLLVEVGRRFNHRVRQGDVLARLGGDEFGVILYNIEPDQLPFITKGYLEALSGFNFNWDGSIFDVTCSIGSVMITGDISSPAEAMRQADIACYISKDSGRSRYHVYRKDDEQSVGALGEMHIVRGLHNALSVDDFVLHYQPIKDLQSDTITIYEALLRLKHSDGSLVRPANFIPVAERHGIMAEIDYWVIDNLLQLLLDHSNLDRHPDISINLSGYSMVDNKILNRLETFADNHPDAARKVILEVTETHAITQLERASTFLKKLRSKGIRFALDDFGTGFSSLSYLKHLPVDYVKIDGTFVRDIVDDPSDQALVRSVNHIAHALGKKTIAEYVENRGILTLLTQIGVDMVQGYDIGKPGPEYKLNQTTG